VQDPSAYKVPPHSEEAEQSVLGGLLLDESAWDRVADRIGSEDFYQHAHKVIFEAVGQLIDANRPPDLVTLAENLERQGRLEEVGGTAYLASLANNTPTAANIAHYAQVVRERALLRSLITAATEISEDAFNPGARSVADILDNAEQRIFSIADESSQRREGFSPLRELMLEGMNRLDELYHQNDPLTGLPTGFQDLDDRTSGLQASDLIVIAGRPSMGKTSFVMNMAENVITQDNPAPVALFSLEMPREQLTMRLLASRARIDAHKMRNGNLADDDWPRLTQAVGELAEAPLYIDDTPGLGPIEIRARCRRLKREHGLGLVIVDYLQLMQTPGEAESRAVAISDISRSLKALARELDVPVIALSQLNRGLEQRSDKRPMMSDLRESGAIEQDADVIMFIYRDEVYHPDNPEVQGLAELIVAKQRNGPTGTVRLTFLGEYTRFENYAGPELASEY
jgi:replicative DNA helicase